jgi:transcription elongation factor Elf1
MHEVKTRREKNLPHRCKFDRTRKCGYSDSYCEKCEVRKAMKQQMLVPEPPDKTQTVSIEYTTKIFACPFCLYRGDITKFYVRIKKGVSDKQFKCPDCGEIMRRDTLTKDMSIEQYAQWMYDTRGWERVKFAVWKQRLKDYGWSWRFWNEYKKHKAEMSEDTESYEEHIARQQKEEHEEEVSMHDEEEY